MTDSFFAFLPAATVLSVILAVTPYVHQQQTDPSRTARYLHNRAAVPDVIVTSFVNSLDENGTTKIDHAFWYERVFRTRPSPADLLCIKNGSVYHAPSKGCYDLFDQGPCTPREWLVMEGYGDGRGLRPWCARRPCMPGYGFSTEGGTRLCVQEGEACRGLPSASRRSFQYSLRGEGRCVCKGSYLLGADGDCHIVYTRGPCPRGQMVAPSYSSSLDAMKGVCVPNPCQEGLYYVSNQNGTVFENCVENDDLRCSPLLTQLYTKQVNLAVPVCVDLRREAIGPPTRNSGCVRDNRGTCIRTTMRSFLPYDWTLEDELNDSSDDYRSIPSPAASARKRRNLAPYAILSLLLL